MKKQLIFLLSLYTVAHSFAQDPTLEWAISIGGADDEMGYAITTDANGNVYSTGMFEGTVDFDPGPDTLYLSAQFSSTAQMFIQKLDATGKLVWAKAITGNQVIGKSITTDTAGNVYLTGSFGYFADFDPGPDTLMLVSVLQEIFIMKLDSNGSLVWANTMVSSSLPINSGLSITIDSNGNIYTTGYFSSNGANDIFILKLDTSGSLVWARSIVGNMQEYGNSIITDTSFQIYITGYYSSTADFDPGTDTLHLTPNGSVDLFVLKLSQNTSSPVAILENIQRSINIKPNPTTGILTIEGVNGKTEIYSIHGKLVTTTTTQTLDISQVPSGIYFIKTTDDRGGVYTQKVVKE